MTDDTIFAPKRTHIGEGKTEITVEEAASGRLQYCYRVVIFISQLELKLL